LNGNGLSRAAGAQMDVQAVKTVFVPVQKGWNSFFIKTRKTPAGFGCVLGTARKRSPLTMCPCRAKGQPAASKVSDQDIFPKTSRLAWKSNEP
jgi:hypothetical protein